MPKVQLQCKQVIMTNNNHGCELVITYLNMYIGYAEYFFLNNKDILTNMRQEYHVESDTSLQTRALLRGPRLTFGIGFLHICLGGVAPDTLPIPTWPREISVQDHLALKGFPPLPSMASGPKNQQNSTQPGI